MVFLSFAMYVKNVSSGNFMDLYAYKSVDIFLTTSGATWCHAGKQDVTHFDKAWQHCNCCSRLF